MPRKPVTIGEYQFASKKEAKELYSSILNAKGLEEHLEGEDFDYVMALLLNHPHVTQKIGCGVRAIKVGQGYYAKTRCFHIIRVDESVAEREP